MKNKHNPGRVLPTVSRVALKSSITTRPWSGTSSHEHGIYAGNELNKETNSCNGSRASNADVIYVSIPSFMKGVTAMMMEDQRASLYYISLMK